MDLLLLIATLTLCLAVIAYDAIVNDGRYLDRKIERLRHRGGA